MVFTRMSTESKTEIQLVSGVIADASPTNGSDYVRVERHSAVIHLEAISSIVLPN